MGVLTAVLLLASGPDFPPVDEGAKDVQFSEFRQNLMGSIAKKKYDWAIARISGTIKFSFGDEGNKRELLELWQSSPEARDEFFANLLECLKHGGQFQKLDGKRLFVAPYVFSAWPSDLDAFEHVAVLPEAIGVYADADETSERLTMVGHTVLRVDYSRSEQGWRRVEYEEDKWGFIKESAVRSPIDYRAIFERDENGSYVLVTFVAGD